MLLLAMIPVFTLLQPCGLSDHKVKIASFALKTVRHLPSFRCVRLFRRCDWEKLRDALRSALWQTMNVFDDINDKWFISVHCYRIAGTNFRHLRKLLFTKQEDLHCGLLTLFQQVYGIKIRQSKLLKDLDLIWIEISIANLKMNLLYARLKLTI